MLKDVHAVVESYAQQVEQRQKDAIAQAKDLAISARFRHQLTDSMKASEKAMKLPACLVLNSRI